MIVERKPCPHCGQNRWRVQVIQDQTLLIPDGKFVEGYISVPYVTEVERNYWCTSCNWKEGGNPTVIVPSWRHTDA